MSSSVRERAAMGVATHMNQFVGTTRRNEVDWTDVHIKYTRKVDPRSFASHAFGFEVVVRGDRYAGTGQLSAITLRAANLKVRQVR